MAFWHDLSLKIKALILTQYVQNAETEWCAQRAIAQRTSSICVSPENFKYDIKAIARVLPEMYDEIFRLLQSAQKEHATLDEEVRRDWVEDEHNILGEPYKRLRLHSEMLEMLESLFFWLELMYA